MGNTALKKELFEIPRSSGNTEIIYNNFIITYCTTLYL